MGYYPDMPFVEFWKDFLKFCFPNLHSYYHMFECMLRDPRHFLYGMWLDFEEYYTEERHWWDPLVSDLVLVFEDFAILYGILSTDLVVVFDGLYAILCTMHSYFMLFG